MRPTDPTRRPDDIRKYLSPDQFKLYQLIWQRFMASQMAPAVFDTTTVDFDIPAKEQPQIGRRSYLFRSTGSIIKFQGFLALYREAREEGDSKALEDEQALPVVELGENIPVHLDHAVAALHRAAAALLRGEPREGAGAARHRTPVDVRDRSSACSRTGAT